VVLHPPWNVPRSIAVGELLPLLRSDPGYAARVGIRVYEGAGGAVRSIDPATIEWSALSDSVFPYQLVQGPGPANPLGRLKLVFANPFNVCVHDTPARSLFAAETRAFSHGCIRADRIADLAGALLRDDPAWPPGAVGRALQRDAERWIALREPVPVHVGYWTAWIGEDGAVQWRPDLYGWDAKVLTAFEAVPPRFPRD
jgi:murein L,D-transpeptidase YcbB/YkuD